MKKTSEHLVAAIAALFLLTVGVGAGYQVGISSYNFNMEAHNSLMLKYVDALNRNAELERRLRRPAAIVPPEGGE